MRRNRLVLLILLASSLWMFAPKAIPTQADTFPQRVIVPPTWQIIELTNAERQAVGLPPLAYNSFLKTSAQFHSQSMGDDGFVAHVNPNTGSTFDQRIVSAGYPNMSAAGENIYAGSSDPAIAVDRWMNSPDHRDNILNTAFREIGVGYVQVPDDPQGYYNYWTQNFGTRFDYFPIIIENEAYYTSNGMVDVYVYGADIGATEMRFSVDGSSFGDWQPFASTATLTLGIEDGEHQAAVEIRTRDGAVYSAVDTINVLNASSLPPTEASASTQPPATPIVNPPPIAENLPTSAVSIDNPTGLGGLQATAGPSSTPSGTPTPTNVAVVSDVRPSHGSLQSKPSTLESWSCYDFWWWVIPLVIAVILLLLLMLHRQINKHFWFAQPNCGLRCRLFRIVFLLYLILLGYLLGNQIGGMCGQSGTLIWRIDSREADIVSISNRVPVENVHWVDGLNNEGCTGCHIYEDQSRRLIYTEGGLTGQVVLFDRDTETSTRLHDGTQALLSSYVSLSRDGTRLALALNDNDIYIYDFIDETLTRVDAAATPDYVETMPVWGANGITLLFVRTEEPTQGGAILQNPTDLYEYNFETDTITPVAGASESGIFEYYPELSTDGRWLVFTRHSNRTTYADEAAEIWLMDLQRSQDPMSIATGGASWPRFSQDQRWLAYHSQKYDEVSDILAVPFDADTGVSGDPILVEGAYSNGVFEHLPDLWTIEPPLTLAGILGNWVWWLLPLLPFFLLAVFWCYPRLVEEEEEVLVRREKRLALPPLIPALVQKRPAWQTQPALVIGLGRSGRWVLTHLKKTLQDAGVGEVPANISLMCVAAGNVARFDQPNAQQNYRFGGVELTPDEILEWRNNLQNLVQQADQDPALQGWLDREYLNALGAAGQNPRVGLFNQRVLGRLAVIDNLRNTTDDEHLWQRLKRQAEAAVHNNRLTVLIVANMADDVGSGGVLDIAYLCRRLEQELNLSNVTIIGHFMTDRVEPIQPPHHSQVNTAAFLRELARFQLSQANLFKFKMDYGPVPYTGYNETTLFNQLYVYDGATPTFNGVKAENGIYPAIADSLALWLDSGSVRLTQSRNQNISAAQTAQLESQDLLVSSLGIYQYRLPVADLLEDVVLRYVRVALHIFLAGGDANKISQWPQKLSYEQSSERFLNRANEDAYSLAGAFLAETFGTPDLSSRGLSLIRALVDGEPQNLKKAIRRGRRDLSDVNSWRQWLQDGLMILLNGEMTSNESPNYLAKRTGKLGLVIDFLWYIANQDGTGILNDWQRRIQEIGENEDAVAQLAAFAEVTIALRDAYIAIGQSLVLARGETLYRHLENRAIPFDERQEELARLSNRVYLWEDANGQALRDKWYEPIANNFAVLLSRLYWGFDKENQPILTLRQLDSTDIQYDPENIAKFADAMLEIGYIAADAVWRNESVQDILTHTVFEGHHRDKTLDSIFKRSAPALNYTQQQNLLPTYLVAEEQPTPLVHAYVQQRIAQAVHFSPISITDRFSFAMAQVIDGVQISQTNFVTQAFDQYQQENGLAGAAYDPRANIPTSIFAAERTALSYERRLTTIRRQRRMFHPITVTLLTHRDHLIVYLLSATTINKPNNVCLMQLEKTETHSTVHLQAATFKELLDINIPVQLTNLVETDSAVGTIGLFIRGLLNFIEKFDDELVQSLKKGLMETMNEDLLATFEQWLKGGDEIWLQTARTQVIRVVIQDLADITQILIRDVI